MPETPAPKAAKRTPETTPLTEVDESFYTWSTFFKLLIGQGDPQDRARYLAMRDVANEESDCKRCTTQRDYLFSYSPIVRFMRDEIQQLGGDIHPGNVRCGRCTTLQTGGFDPRYGIMLCANHIEDKGRMEDTLAHEMVHAYDHLRWKVDWTNLRHQACSEIRASTLSGECRFTREFFRRSQWKFTEQLQECVRRRATISMTGRPGVKDEKHAGQIVNSVWESCFNDTRPFDEIFK